MEEKFRTEIVDAMKAATIRLVNDVDDVGNNCASKAQTIALFLNIISDLDCTDPTPEEVAEAFESFYEGVDHDNTVESGFPKVIDPILEQTT
jgi:hypothetical protein